MASRFSKARGAASKLRLRILTALQVFLGMFTEEPTARTVRIHGWWLLLIGVTMVAHGAGRYGSLVAGVILLLWLRPLLSWLK